MLGSIPAVDAGGRSKSAFGLSSGALRTSISRLRHAIGRDLLVTGPAGYELRADIDVVEYEPSTPAFPGWR